MMLKVKIIMISKSSGVEIVGHQRQAWGVALIKEAVVTQGAVDVTEKQS